MDDTNEQQLRQRPDLAAADEPETPETRDTPTGEASGESVGEHEAVAEAAHDDFADANAEVAAPGDKMGGAGDEAVTVRSDFISHSGPYRADGVIVEDAGGRQLAICGAAHLNPDDREHIAQWIAEKLNA